MKLSKMVALSAVTSAMAIVLLLLGAFIPVLDLSCVMLAGFVTMIPLSKNYYLGAFLSYVATALLALILTGFRLQVIIPYALFLGIHPILNKLQIKFRLNVILAFVIKLIWFLGACFITYFFTEMFVTDSEIIKKYAVWIILFGGSAAFIIYDLFVFRMQRAVEYLMRKLKL